MGSGGKRKLRKLIKFKVFDHFFFRNRSFVKQFTVGCYHAAPT